MTRKPPEPPKAEPKPEPYPTEMTEAGEQAVIPGCELDDQRTGAKQLGLF